GQSRERERAPRRGGVTKCQIEQHDEEREIHDAERGDGEPIAAARPLDPQRECDRQQQQKSNAKSEHAERDRIARPDRKPGGAAPPRRPRRSTRLPPARRHTRFAKRAWEVRREGLGPRSARSRMQIAVRAEDYRASSLASPPVFPAASRAP